MEDFSKLKQYLLSSGRLSEEQILQAEDYALSMNIPLDEAIVFLKLLDFNQLGKVLGEIYGKNYTPVLECSPPEQAKNLVPLKIAERLSVFPVSFDSAENILILATHDPEDELLREKLKNIFPPPVQFQTTIASRPEIKTAIDVHYKGRPYVPEIEVELPEGFTIVTSHGQKAEELDLEDETKGKNILLLEPALDRARPLISLLRAEGFHRVKWSSSPQEAITALKEQDFDLLLVNGQVFRPEGSWFSEIENAVSTPQVSYYDLRSVLLGQEYPYAQMSEALITSLAYIIKRSLRKEPERLKEIMTRVRYCKLLSLRLGLVPVQVDSVILAAWLMGSPMGEMLLKNIETPFHLDEIVGQKEELDRGKRIESEVLRVVTEYLSLKKQKPELASDMDMVRKELAPEFPTDRGKALLEEFLHVIRDEEFLKDVDRAAGRLLIVDPAMGPGSNLELRLINEGYEVLIARDAREAAKMIMASGVDIVLSELNLPEVDGLRFCQALRKKPETEHLPFFFYTNDNGEKLAARCLEAGADDFLSKSSDLDLVCLKIKRALEKGQKKPKRGVTGSLTDLSAMDIIQSVATGDKDVEITLHSNGKKGKIYIQGGEIIHAQSGDLVGEKAFYDLMAFQEGDFEIVPCSKFPGRTVHGNTMSLLMEGARLVDEMAAGMEGISEDD